MVIGVNYIKLQKSDLWDVTWEGVRYHREKSYREYGDLQRAIRALKKGQKYVVGKEESVRYSPYYRAVAGMHEKSYRLTVKSPDVNGGVRQYYKYRSKVYVNAGSGFPVAFDDLEAAKECAINRYKKSNGCYHFLVVPAVKIRYILFVEK